MFNEAVLADGVRPEDPERARALVGAVGSAARAIHLEVIHGQNFALVVIDRTRILLDIAGVVDAARKLAEVPLLDRLQGADTDLCGVGDLLKRDAAILAYGG